MWPTPKLATSRGPGAGAGAVCPRAGDDTQHVTPTAIAAVSPRIVIGSPPSRECERRRRDGSQRTASLLDDRRIRPLLQLRQPVGHPFWRRRALQIVIEELLHPDLKVLLILALPEMMR